MKYPVKEKDITELGLGENEINAHFFEFSKFFNTEFESIEYFRINNQTQHEFLAKKIFYDDSGFIKRIESYNAKGETNFIINYEKTASEIISKQSFEYGNIEQVWKFNQSGNLVEVVGEGSESYRFYYDKNQNLSSVSEGLKFEWENGHISQLINLANNAVIQKVIKRNKFETQIQFLGSVNKNVPAITTYSYDDSERLIKVESFKRYTEIIYEVNDNLKKQITTSYFDNEQTGFHSISEQLTSENKIEVEHIFQQRKSSPKSRSRRIKNKRK